PAGSDARLEWVDFGHAAGARRCAFHGPGHRLLSGRGEPGAGDYNRSGADNYTRFAPDSFCRQELLSAVQGHWRAAGLHMVDRRRFVLSGRRSQRAVGWIRRRGRTTAWTLVRSGGGDTQWNTDDTRKLQLWRNRVRQRAAQYYKAVFSHSGAR